MLILTALIPSINYWLKSREPVKSVLDYPPSPFNCKLATVGPKWLVGLEKFMHSFVVSTTTLVNSYNGIFTDIQESRADNCIFFFGETTSPSGDILQDRWWFPTRLPWCLFFQINNRCIGGVSPSLIANPIMTTQLGQISNIYEN